MSKSEESTFVIILTAIILGLAVMYYCFAPKHNDVATQSRIDRLPPYVINRKTLNYGETMMKLYRDRKQDVLTRDFAVQHIGLYAQALNRRGEYNAASAESQKLRSAYYNGRKK